MSSPLTIPSTCFPTPLLDGAPVIAAIPGSSAQVRCRVLTLQNGVYVVTDAKGNVGRYHPTLIALDLSPQDRGVDGLMVGVRMLAVATGLDPDTATWRLVPKRHEEPLESGQYAWLLTDGTDGVLFYPFTGDSPDTDEWGVPALLGVEQLNDMPRWRREAMRVVIESRVWYRRAAAKAEAP